METVIDNASYHSVQEDKCPTQSSRKADIQAWLTRNNVAWSNHMLKVELLELYRMQRPLPPYVVVERLKQQGHTAIPMPPYHAELNSIELIWAMLKGKVARSNLTLKKKDVKKLTEDAFESISQEDWTSCRRHVKNDEKRFYATDIGVDDQVLFGLMLYVHGKQLRSCRDGQLSYPHCSWASLPEARYQY